MFIRVTYPTCSWSWLCKQTHECAYRGIPRKEKLTRQRSPHPQHRISCRFRRRDPQCCWTKRQRAWRLFLETYSSSLAWWIVSKGSSTWRMASIPIFYSTPRLESHQLILQFGNSASLSSLHECLGWFWCSLRLRKAVVMLSVFNTRRAALGVRHTGRLEKGRRGQMSSNCRGKKQGEVQVGRFRGEGTNTFICCWAGPLV